jgi:hypothetical protein
VTLCPFCSGEHRLIEAKTTKPPKTNKAHQRRKQTPVAAPGAEEKQQS